MLNEAFSVIFKHRECTKEKKPYDSYQCHMKNICWKPEEFGIFCSLLLLLYEF